MRTTRYLTVGNVMVGWHPTASSWQPARHKRSLDVRFWRLSFTWWRA